MTRGAGPAAAATCRAMAGTLHRRAVPSPAGAPALSCLAPSVGLGGTACAYLAPNASLRSTECRRAAAPAWAALRVPTLHQTPACAALRVPSRLSASLRSTERAYLPPNASLHSTECRRATAPAWAALRVPTLHPAPACAALSVPTSHPAPAWVALGAVAPRLRLRGRSGATACRRNLLARGAVPALSALAGPSTLADHQRRGRCPYRPSPSTLVRCRSPVALRAQSPRPASAILSQSRPPAAAVRPRVRGQPSQSLVE